MSPRKEAAVLASAVQASTDDEDGADASIARLGDDIDRLTRLIACLPSFTKHSPERLQWQHELGAKVEERELLMEGERVSEVLQRYWEENPPVDGEVCPICLDPVQETGRLGLFICCGKHTCEACFRNHTSDVGSACPMCRGVLPSSDQESYRMLQSKVDRGHAWAQSLLAQWCTHGSNGVEEDHKKAERLWRLAAEQGYTIAQSELGNLCSKLNIYDEARRWYEKAASKGSASALGGLGCLYLDGQGVEMDKAEGVRLMTIATVLDKNDVDSSARLGECFLKGWGVSESFSRAKLYLKPPAENGDADCMVLYAGALIYTAVVTYDECYGVVGYSPMPLALFWYRRAKGRKPGLIDDDFEKLENDIQAHCARCSEALTGKEGEQLKRCSECKAAYYCGRDCQVLHWKAGHKNDCIKRLKKSLPAD